MMAPRLTIKDLLEGNKTSGTPSTSAKYFMPGYPGDFAEKMLQLSAL
jgi:hypothetical protein